MAVLSQTSRTFFTGYNVATSAYIYNENASTNNEAGKLGCKADHVNVQVCVATLVGTIDCLYRIEGRSDTINRWAQITASTVTDAMTIDKLHTISPHIKEVRVGVKRSGTVASPLGSPCHFYAGITRTEIK